MLPAGRPAAAGLALAAGRHPAGAAGLAPAPGGRPRLRRPALVRCRAAAAAPRPARRGHDSCRMSRPSRRRAAALAGHSRRCARSPPTVARSAASRRHFQPGRRLLVLTADGAAPAEIGRCLAERGLRRQPHHRARGAGRHAASGSSPAPRRGSAPSALPISTSWPSSWPGGRGPSAAAGRARPARRRVRP